MRILLLIGLLLWPQQPGPAWSLAVGVQMPAANPRDIRNGIDMSRVTLYFKGRTAAVKPVCRVVFAVREAGVSDVQIGYVTVTGKPETRIDIECKEVPQ